MLDTLTSLVYEPLPLHLKNNSVSYFVDNEWVYFTYGQITQGGTIVADCLKSVGYELKLGKYYVGLHLNVTYTFPSVVLGVLQSGNAFACLEPSSKESWKRTLLNRLIIPVIVTNTLVSFKDEDFEKKATINLLGESLFIWTTDNFSTSQTCASSIVYAIQTSGSTGGAKIVQVPHSSIVPNIIDLSNSFKITHEDVIYFGSPITFDPSIVELFLALTNGSTLCIVENKIKQDPQTLLDVLFPPNGSVITLLQTTPSLFRRWPLNLLRSRIFEPVSKFRHLVLGGEHFPADCLTQWNIPDRINIYNIYGITEVSCWASLNLVKGYENAIDIGKPLLRTKLSLRDCDADGIGEMFIGSNQRICIVGEECPSILLKDEYKYRPTGDLFKVRNGAYHFMGRKDSVIKKWGVRVDLLKIESVAKSHKDINTAVCICISQISLPTLGLFIVPNAKDNFDKDSFRVYLRKTLPKEGMPDLIKILSEIPLSCHGKLNHFALKKSFLEENDSLDPLLKFLNLWQHYTIETPLLSHNFLDSGGDSFAALQITSTLESQFETIPESLLGLLLRRGSTLEECCGVVTHHDGYKHVINYVTNENSKFKKTVSDLKQRMALINPEKVMLHGKTIEHNVCKKQKMCKGPTNKLTEYTVTSIKSKGVTQLFENEYEECLNISEENFLLQEKWKYHLGKCIDASPVGVTYKSGKKVVIVSSHSGKIVLIDADVGNIISESQLPDRIESSACLSKCGEYYFIGCYDGCLYKINLESGLVIWSFVTGDIIKSTAITYKDIIIFGSYDKFVYCISEKEGRLKWKTQLKGPILATPQQKDNMIFFATLKGSLEALDAESGKISWDRDMSPVFSNPVILENCIVVAEAKGTLYWFNTKTGNEMSSFKGGDMIFSSLAVNRMQNNAYIAFGCHDGNVYCLHKGNLVWKSNLHCRIVASPFFFFTKTAILISVATIKGNVYILNCKDGSILVSYQLPEEVFSSPIVMNDNVVVGCRDDNLYFLKLKLLSP